MFCKSILTTIFLITVTIQIFPQHDLKTVEAVKTTSPTIDGIFNDDEWSNGGVASDFIQRDPDDGKPMTQKTEAYFLYDENNLYVGIKLYDSEPEKIMSGFAGYDDYGTADYVGLMLDTFHDHENGYFFALTASGNKVDGIYFDNYKESDEWDGIWYGEAGRTNFGWCAEFKIPFALLKFEQSVNQWGLNIYRNINRNLEYGYWQYQSREINFRVSQFGHLTGLKNINSGLNLEVTPYATSRLVKDRVENFRINNRNGITGVDVKYGITSNLNAILTINPDFAQIEADEDQINLDRYPLYLSEKRPFFTEGSSIFNIAGDNAAGQLFYSRRINEPVYGLKATGKIGSWDIGILHAMNDNDYGITSGIEKGEIDSTQKPTAYYNILRLSHDVFGNSKIGIVGLSKEYNNNYNRIIGIDGTFRFAGTNTLVVGAQKSFTNNFKEKNHSFTAVLFKLGDFFSYVLRYDEKAPNFIGNDLGYYEYNDKRYLGGWVQFAPRFEKYGIRMIKSKSYYIFENFWESKFFDYSTLSRFFLSRLTIQTMNYWEAEVECILGNAFDRFDTKLYNENWWEFSLRNNSQSDVSFELTHNQGKYFGGYSWSYLGNIEIRPTDKVRLLFDYSRSLVKLPDEETGLTDLTTYEIMRSKLYYHFNRDLNVRLILQYNKHYQRLDASFLIAYRFLPGCAFYLAYNEMYDSKSYTNKMDQIINPTFSAASKILQLKFSYLFQL